MILHRLKVCISLTAAILFLSPLSASGSTCHNLLESSSVEKKLELESRDRIEEINDLSTDFSNTFPFMLDMRARGQLTRSQWAEVRSSYRVKFELYQKLLETHLTKLGIDFAWRDLPNLKLKQLLGHEQTLVIVPNNRSPLNRLARDLDQKYGGVSVIYDPIALRKYMGQAAFSPNNKALYLNLEAAAARYPDEIDFATTLHEVLHAISNAYRLGVTNENSHVVHVRIKNGGDQFALEEILAHALSIQTMAKVLSNPIEGGADLKQNGRMQEAQMELKTNISTSWRYIQQALDVLEKIDIESLRERKRFRSSMEWNNQKWVKVSSGGSEALVFVHPQEMQDFQKAPGRFVELRLKRAKKLVKAAQYFLKIHHSLTHDDLVALAGYFDRQTQLSVSSMIPKSKE